jgi:hypothetical protein
MPRLGGIETLEWGVHSRLRNEFGVAVRELLILDEQQYLAIVEGDADCSRFDLFIHMANEQKHAMSKRRAVRKYNAAQQT